MQPRQGAMPPLTGRGGAIPRAMRAGVVKTSITALASGIAVGLAVVATVAGVPLGRGESSDAPVRTAESASTGKSQTTARSARRSAAGLLTSPTPRRIVTEERYIVRAGDTLWDIAARHYEDTSAAMFRIKKRNGLRRDKVLAGEVLVLPPAGRRSIAPSGPTPDDHATDAVAANEAPAP